MLNYVITTLSIHLKESERNKTKQIIEMKQPKRAEPRYGYCGHCGQYLPWFCVCYLTTPHKNLNKKEDI